jgi:phosphinothricin acetyltransferase
MRARIRRTLERWPWLACEVEGEVLGYAYASEHRARAAYQWAVDVSAYVHEDHRGKGIGRALYTSLFALLKLQNYYHAYAGIALPNASSVGLHEAMGFQLVGIYRSTGYKLGTWHDVGWWHLALQELSANPPLPLSLSQAQELPGWADQFSAGLTHLLRK